MKTHHTAPTITNRAPRLKPLVIQTILLATTLTPAIAPAFTLPNWLLSPPLFAVGPGNPGNTSTTPTSVTGGTGGANGTGGGQAGNGGASGTGNNTSAVPPVFATNGFDADTSNGGGFGGQLNGIGGAGGNRGGNGGGNGGTGTGGGGGGGAAGGGGGGGAGDNTNTAFSVGGGSGGGGGGTAVLQNGSGTLLTNTGGAGGAGGNANNNAGAGGGGGGGNAVVVTGTEAVITISGANTGGLGGAGGSHINNGSTGAAGGGGAGGNGVVLTNIATVVINTSGSSIGGQGGIGGGMSATAAINNTGRPGNGGLGLWFETGGSLTNSGAVRGGLGGAASPPINNTVTSPAGQGGHGVLLMGGGTINNLTSGVISGGNGGSILSSGAATNPGAVGGAGILTDQTTTMTNAGTIQGGNGSSGGSSTGSFAGGTGGTGGVGIQGQIVVLTNDTAGVITGGLGGSGGMSSTGLVGVGGIGGIGVSFSQATIINNQQISGGAGGGAGSGTIANLGGVGGAGLDGTILTLLTNTGSIRGGAGGAGNGAQLQAGGGGSGGVAINISQVAVIRNIGSITAGQGGIGDTNTNSTYSGTGGAGGIAINGASASSLTIINNGSIRAGDGGGSFNTNNQPGNGGNGGTAINSDLLTITNGGTITAGNGGQGSSSAANNGNGGNGGAAINVNQQAIITNNTGGQILGGTGGVGGSIITRPPGLAGTGGIGIQGQNITLINDGVIQGGLTAGSMTASNNAVVFTNGTNQLELHSQSTIAGNVVAVVGGQDTLTLGGSNNGSFDVSTVGNGAQYQNFTHFTKTGSSLWQLVGTNTAFLPTVVSAGSLAVNGTINSSVMVQPSARLQGTGIIGDTTVLGTIAPGNSIGKLTINGNYVQQPDSIYEVEINSVGLSDLIDITGSATINGGTVNVVKEAGNYTPQTYTILTATAGVTGSYTNLTQNLPLLDFIISQDANNVYLTVEQNNTPFTFFTATPNQAQTAIGVQSLGLGNPVYNAIINSPTVPALQQALDSLSGELYASSLGAMMEDSRYLRDAVLTHLASDEQQPNRTTGIQAWAHGFGATGELHGNRNASELTRRSQGFFIGVDKDLGDVARVGLVGGYGHSHYHIAVLGSNNRQDNYHVGVYGKTALHAVALRAGAAYTGYDLTAERTVAFPNFRNQLTSDYSAHNGQVFGEMAYRLPIKAIAIEPLLNLAFVTLHANRLSEQGGSAALAVHATHQNIGYTTLGAREYGLLYQANDMLVTQRLFLGWRHGYDHLIPATALAFASGGSPFSITGTPIARDALVIDAGAELVGQHTDLRLRLSYLGQFGSRVQDNGLMATLVWNMA